MFDYPEAAVVIGGLHIPFAVKENGHVVLCLANFNL